MGGPRVARWGSVSEFVASLVRTRVDVWDGVVVKDHPLHETLVSYLRDRVSVH